MIVSQMTAGPAQGEGPGPKPSPPPAPRPPHTHIFSEIIIKEVVIKFFGKCVYLYNATVLVFSPVHNK